MTCHLINKAVMKQNCIETLNQQVQPREKSCLVGAIDYSVNIHVCNKILLLVLLLLVLLLLLIGIIIIILRRNERDFLDF